MLAYRTGTARNHAALRDGACRCRGQGEAGLRGSLPDRDDDARLRRRRLPSVFALILSSGVRMGSAGRRSAPDDIPDRERPDPAGAGGRSRSAIPSFNAALPPLDSVTAPPPPGAPTPTASRGDRRRPIRRSPAAAAARRPSIRRPTRARRRCRATRTTRIRYTMKIDGLRKDRPRPPSSAALSALETGKKKAANAAQVAARADSTTCNSPSG